MADNHLLPSWRPGNSRDALIAFLESIHEIPPGMRLACFDNDGTLWCEKPTYIQMYFFLDALKTAVGEKPDLAEKPEFAALIDQDQKELAALGLEKIVGALTGLFVGTSPEKFAGRARDFMVKGTHPDKGRPLEKMVYQPMLEVIDALRQGGFTIAVTTGGGTEFVRAISDDLYGVPPELVVGTLITYDYDTDEDGTPHLRRTDQIQGKPNEGPPKVSNIQAQLGRRPVVAFGNSGGDREMLEWAAGGELPGLAVLIDHDDAEREYAYEGTAATFKEAKPIAEAAVEEGWTVVSMKSDWETIFPE